MIERADPNQELEDRMKEREHRLHDAIDAGAEAEIARKVYAEAFEEARQAMLDGFRKSRPNQSDVHEQLKFYLDVIDDVEERVNNRVTKGKSAWRKLMELRNKNPLRRMING